MPLAVGWWAGAWRPTECELLARRKKSKDLKEAERAVFECIEGWYNPHREHFSIDYYSPINYENKCWKRTQELKRWTVH